jgi:hypothetical protein
MPSVWNKKDWQLAGDPSYAEYLLKARGRFLQHNAATVEQIRNIYSRAAADIARDIKDLTPGTLRYNHLSSLQKMLEGRARTMNAETLDAIYNGIKLSVSDGTSGTQMIMQDLFRYDRAGVKWMFADINEQAVLSLIARTGKDGLKLSDRVWRIGEHVRDNLNTVVEDAVTRGLDSRTLAKQIQQYMQPGKWTAMKKETRRRLGVRSDVSYEAMRLARTEMSNAYHEGTILANQSAPSYLGIIWLLSGSHPLPDVCDDYAGHNGDGFWAKGSEPPLPHPQCLCVALPKHEKPDAFTERLRNWAQNPSVDNELERWYNTVGSRYINRPLSFAMSGRRSVNHIIDIDDAGTLKECTDWAKSKYTDIEFDFDGADVTAIKPTLKEFDKLASQFPDVVKHIRSLNTAELDPNVYAHTVITHRGADFDVVIEFNNSFYSDAKRLIKFLRHDVEEGFHPKGADHVETILTHEFGHALSYWLQMQSQKTVLPYVGSDGVGIVRDTFLAWRDKHLSDKKAVAKISGYAETNMEEAWAEVFTAIHHGLKRNTLLVKRGKAVLKELADTSKWQDGIKFATDIEDKEARERAFKEIQNLRERLGLI